MKKWQNMNYNQEKTQSIEIDPEMKEMMELAEKAFKNAIIGTSLMALWLRICLPMQGTRV